MNSKKLRELVSADVYLDLEHAKEHELKVYYDPGDTESWFVIDPKKFEKDEVLAAIINAKSQIKLASKATAKKPAGVVAETPVEPQTEE